MYFYLCMGERCVQLVVARKATIATEIMLYTIMDLCWQILINNNNYYYFACASMTTLAGRRRVDQAMRGGSYAISLRTVKFSHWTFPK